MSEALNILNKLVVELEDYNDTFEKIYSRLTDDCVSTLQYLGFRMDYFEEYEHENEEGVFVDLVPAAMCFFGRWSEEKNRFILLTDL